MDWQEAVSKSPLMQALRTDHSGRCVVRNHMNLTFSYNPDGYPIEFKYDLPSSEVDGYDDWQPRTEEDVKL